MITVSISGRKATLLKTADLPTGNDNSIKVNFIFSATDPVWKGATKVAIFVAITPRGLRKTLPAVIDSDGECFIPGKILSTPFSKISVGAMATYEDGSSVASNLVFVNSTDAGAGGDNIYDEEELPIDKNDFEMFMAELAASIGVQIVEMQSDLKELEPIADSLDIDEKGKLKVNGENILDYSQMFHLMSRHNDAFKVEYYWDLLEYDASEERTDPNTGEKYTQIKKIDLRPGTRDGDTVYVQCPKGNYVRQEDIKDMLGFLPKLDIVYPIIHFWQKDLPAPSEDEEKTEAYALFTTKDGVEYKIHRYFSSKYGVWIVEFSMNQFEGSWIYSWEDTSILTKNHYEFIKDGEVIPWNDKKHPIGIWPVASDVKCVELQNPEKLSCFMFNHFPRNIHPAGRYVYDGQLEKWKKKAGDMTTFTFTLTKEEWSWENRKTLVIGGCIPSDIVNFYANESNIKIAVVGQGYNHVTIEASELPTEDIKVTMTMTNTVERNDTYGSWRDY